MPINTNRSFFHARRGGFMLLELLIVMGIIGIAISVTIVAVSPRKTLRSVRDTERHYTVRELNNALLQYLLKHLSYPDDARIPTALEAAKPVCTQGVTTNAACVRLDALLPDYLVGIPRDEIEPCPDFTGYQLYKKGGNVQVLATHTGKLSGDELTVLPGCSSAVSSSSVSSASSSSSFSSQASSAPVSSAPVSSAMSSASSSSSLFMPPASSDASSSVSSGHIIPPDEP